MDRFSTDIEVIDNLVDEDYCYYIIDKLYYAKDVWNIAYDENTISKNYTWNKVSNKSDTGFLFLSYSKDATDEKNKKYAWLTSLVDYIYFRYLQSSKYEYKNPELHRVLFNYYNTGSDGIDHTDATDPNVRSVTINLNTNDGGTLVENEFVPSQVGRGVAFNSNIRHRGVGPTEVKQRFAVNVVFTYDDVRLKT